MDPLLFWLLIVLIFVITAVTVASSYQALSPQWEVLKRSLTRGFVYLGIALGIGVVLLFSWHVAVIAIMNHGFLTGTLPDNTILHFNPFTNVITVEFGPLVEGKQSFHPLLLEHTLNLTNLKRFDLYAYLIPYHVRLDESGSVVLP